MRSYFAIYSILIFTISLYGRSYRNVHGKFTIDDIQKSIQFRISTPRMIYEEGEIVPITFQITNKGIEAFRFFIDQKYGNSMFLEILDPDANEIHNQLTFINHKNIPINQLQKNQIEDLSGNPVKEIILHPNETFSKTFYIQGFPIGKFRIIGFFIPLSFDIQYKKNLQFLSKNQIKISIQKPHSVFRFDDEIQIPKEPIPSPEETVYLFLMAEYQKRWENYFKYVELSKLIQSYELFAKDYKMASLRKKQIILNQFKKFLSSLPSEPILSFKIQKTIYKNPYEAYVYAEVTRGKSSYRVQYQYQYLLVKKQVWKIHKVTVSIQKTGK